MIRGENKTVPRERIPNSLGKSGRHLPKIQKTANCSVPDVPPGAHAVKMTDKTHKLPGRIGRDNGKEKEAVVSLKQFLSNISHDLRTPMNGVIGMIDLLQDTNLTPQQQEYMSMANKSALTLMSKINDMLDFFKIKSNKIALSMNCFSLRAMMIEIVESFGIRARRKNLELKSIAMPDVPDRIIGDSTVLRQILNNLLDNAVKFTDKGEAAISVGCIKRTFDEACLHFFISDTGTGIDEEHLEVIENEFTQGDGSITRRFGGMGLGLAIASHLVREMGGELHVRSAVGQGSIFHFKATFGLEQTVEIV
jgi:signal transduction histidine kinase